MLPTIQVDGKLTKVIVSDVTVWYSYETCIAFKVGGDDPVVRDNEWSTTTAKHLNQVDDGIGLRVDSATFEKMWRAVWVKQTTGLFG